ALGRRPARRQLREDRLALGVPAEHLARPASRVEQISDRLLGPARVAGTDEVSRKRSQQRMARRARACPCDREHCMCQEGEEGRDRERAGCGDVAGVHALASLNRSETATSSFSPSAARATAMPEEIAVPPLKWGCHGLRSPVGGGGNSVLALRPGRYRIVPLLSGCPGPDLDEKKRRKRSSSRVGVPGGSASSA